MSVGGSIRPAQLAGILVGERAVASSRAVSPHIWRAQLGQLDATPGALVRDAMPDGSRLLDAAQAHELVAHAAYRGASAADDVLRAALREGAWRRDGGDLVPLRDDAIRQALDGAAGVARRPPRSLPTLPPPVDRALRIGAAAGITGGGGLLVQRALDDGGGAAAGGADDLPPGTGAGAAANAAVAAVQGGDGAHEVRRRVAELAAEQVGVLDTDANGLLSSEVASYMDASEGADKTVHREWQGDFVGWLWREAGVPLGQDAVGAGDVSSLVDWASDSGRWQAGALRPSSEQRGSELGTLVVLAETPGGDPTDVGVVVRTADDTVELVQGNRATEAAVGDSEVGGVRRVVLHRDDPIILGRVDPLVADPRPAPSAAPPVAPAPAAPAVPPGSPVRGAQPPPSSATAPDAAQLEAVIDWSVAQYAKDEPHAAMLRTLMRNVMSQESAFRINALNLWDKAAWDFHTPSYGPYQYLRPTFSELQPKAQRANPDAWAKLGAPSRTDWRHQTLTTAWALAQPPSQAGLESGSFPKVNGKYWSRWYSIRDLKNKGHDPRTSDVWKGVLKANEAKIAAPVEQVTTYPNGWKGAGRALPPAELRQIISTGETYAIPRP